MKQKTDDDFNVDITPFSVVDSEVAGLDMIPIILKGYQVYDSMSHYVTRAQKGLQKIILPNIFTTIQSQQLPVKIWRFYFLV